MGKSPKLTELSKYARSAGRTCITCTSPHRAFIEEAYKAGYNIASIMRYLNEQFNAGMNPVSVRRHFNGGHHEEA